MLPRALKARSDDALVAKRLYVRRTHTEPVGEHFGGMLAEQRRGRDRRRRTIEVYRAPQDLILGPKLHHERRR